jgi:hypothetical protein
MRAFNLIATTTIIALMSLFSIQTEAQTLSSRLYVLEGKRNMGVLATQEGNRIRLVYNYRIRFEGAMRDQQAIWKSAHNLQTQEEYVCHKGSSECVNTKYEELKLTRSKDGKSLRVVGPAELIDYTFVQYKGSVNVL